MSPRLKVHEGEERQGVVVWRTGKQTNQLRNSKCRKSGKTTHHPTRTPRTQAQLSAGTQQRKHHIIMPAPRSAPTCYSPYHPSDAMVR